VKAQEGYRKRVIQELNQALEDAKAGRQITTQIRLPAPEDHTADYDRVIRMLEMSVDDELEITSHEFDWYVMDNWQWKGLVSQTCGMYVD